MWSTKPHGTAFPRAIPPAGARFGPDRRWRQDRACHPHPTSASPHRPHPLGIASTPKVLRDDRIRGRPAPRVDNSRYNDYPTCILLTPRNRQTLTRATSNADSTHLAVRDGGNRGARDLSPSPTRLRGVDSRARNTVAAIRGDAGPISCAPYSP